jgi:hypothetical protein
MSEVTRNVILDLLPLYLEGEVSEDTSRLVREYLDSDPQLAEIAQHEAESSLLDEVPISLSKEKAMEKFIETKKWLTTRTVILNLIMALSFVLIFGCLFMTLLLSKFMELIGPHLDTGLLGKVPGFLGFLQL